MYPNKKGQLHHQKTGYFEWMDEGGRKLDMYGDIANPAVWQQWHIIPQVQ